MTPTPPRTSRLDPVIEVLLIALLAFMPAPYGVVAAWSEGIAYATGAAIALCLAIRAVAAPQPREARFSLAWIAIALFILVVAAQLVPLPMSVLRAVSPQTATMKAELLGDLPDAAEILAREPITFYPLGTRQDLRIVLLATTIFAAVVTVYRDERRIRRLLAAVALIGLAYGALALAQDLTRAERIYWRVPIAGLARSGTFFNHSHYGQFMNLSVGCALALLLARLTDAPRMSLGQMARRTAWLAAMIVVGLATISLSLTRGGTIGILASAAFATVVLLTSRNLRQMAGVIILLLLATLAFLFYHGFEAVYARMIEPGLGARIQMIHDTVAMWRTFPSFGVGLGAYDWIFPMFDRSFVPSTAEYVENEYVQALVDTGPLGLAAVLLFVAVIAVRYVRAIRNHEDERIGLAAVGLGYGLVAVMVHSLSDFGQHLPAIAGLSAVTCGLLFNLGERRRRENGGGGGGGGGARTIRIGRGVAVVALLGVAAIAAWVLIDAARAWRAERHWSRTLPVARSLARNDWTGPDARFAALLDAANRAVAAEPDNATYRYWAAIYRWYWLRAQADPQAGLQVNDQTVVAAQRVIGELNETRVRAPTYGLVYTMLGQIELNFLGRESGYAHIQAGHRLSRNDAYAAFVAGEADARRGEFDKATPALHEAIRIDRDMVDDVIDLYLDDVNRPELAAAGIGDDYFALIRLRDRLRANDEWKALANQAEARAAQVLAAECERPGAPPWKFASVATHYQEQQRYEPAEKYFARALQGEPTNLYWRVRRADVLHKLGRTAEALAEARLALQQHPTAPESRAMMQLLTGGAPTP
jgi:O-antigen ligase/tetratricopeptide (TPR) repeat protein